MDYGIAFFGSLLYNYFLFNREKNKADKQNKKFDWRQYFSKTWDDIGFTILCAPVLVYYMVDIVNIIRHWFYEDLPYFSIYHLGVGVLTQVVYLGFDKFMSLVTSFKINPAKKQ